jgi:hypothetical protein
MRKLFLPVIFLLPIFASLGQIPQYEKVASEFFFTKVFVVEYPSAVDVKFSGHTEGSTDQLDYAAKCLAELVGQNLPEDIPGPGKDGPILISSLTGHKIRIRKLRAKSRLRFGVYNAIQINGYLYVGIEVNKAHHFLDTYFLKLSQDGSVVEWCKYPMVI